MPRKAETLGEWITSRAAADILTKNSGHEVSDAYVRRLGLQGKISTKRIDDRTKLYLKRDVENYRVSTQRGPKPAKQKEDAA